MTDERVLAEALHGSYPRNPDVTRIEWSDLGEWDRAMWLGHAKRIAANLDAAGYVIVPKDWLAALERVREAAERNQEAWAGRGHEGPHDAALHEVGKHDDLCLGTWSEDCSACGGAMYGCDAELYDALDAAGGRK